MFNLFSRRTMLKSATALLANVALPFKFVKGAPIPEDQIYEKDFESRVLLRFLQLLEGEFPRNAEKYGKNLSLVRSLDDWRTHDTEAIWSDLWEREHRWKFWLAAVHLGVSAEDVQSRDAVEETASKMLHQLAPCIRELMYITPTVRLSDDGVPEVHPQGLRFTNPAHDVAMFIPMHPFFTLRANYSVPETISQSLDTVYIVEDIGSYKHPFLMKTRSLDEASKTPRLVGDLFFTCQVFRPDAEVSYMTTPREIPLDI